MRNFPSLIWSQQIWPLHHHPCDTTNPPPSLSSRIRPLIPFFSRRLHWLPNLSFQKAIDPLANVLVAPKFNAGRILWFLRRHSRLDHMWRAWRVCIEGFCRSNRDCLDFDQCKDSRRGMALSLWFLEMPNFWIWLTVPYLGPSRGSLDQTCQHTDHFIMQYGSFREMMADSDSEFDGIDLGSRSKCRKFSRSRSANRCFHQRTRPQRFENFCIPCIGCMGPSCTNSTRSSWQSGRFTALPPASEMFWTSCRIFALAAISSRGSSIWPILFNQYLRCIGSRGRTSYIVVTIISHSLFLRPFAVLDPPTCDGNGRYRC